MSRIISIHSFRRGTGKSTVIANMAAVLAQEGKRVAVVDAGFRAPSTHILFGLSDDEIHNVVNDFIWGRCDIEQAAYDLTERFPTRGDGRLFLVPASTSASEIAFISRTGYDVNLLNEGLRALIDTLNLDVLMMDTHAGINEETLLSIALCDVMGLITRLDRQDHQGTAILIDLARRLGVPDIKLILNEIVSTYDLSSVKEEAETIYKTEVILVLPHSEDIMALSSTGLLVMQASEHPITSLLAQAARHFMD